ncbi:MAG: dockerin type I domain-containing protein [Planctomycetota bacterium]|nr:dockerin type I domain-containing protein [Planctomycetota bacterium]
MSRRHQRRLSRRFLSMETLEGRRLLAVDLVAPEVPPQNFANPEDANYDGFVSPADALIVINELNRGDESGSPKSSSTDIDGDGVVTPRDALLVINRLNSRRDTSSVPPQQRAIGLRRALDAGYVPPNMSPSGAQEMLETLENGGHYEAGDRYRNGQMLNINDPPQDSHGPVAGAASEGAAPAQQSVGPTSENLLPETTSPRSVEENDPLALFDSAVETLSDPVHDASLWRAFFDSRDAGDAEGVDRFSTQLAERLAERLASTGAREQIAQAVADALQNGDNTAEGILEEIAALRATLGDAHSQIAQLFANLDVEGIIEQLGVDLGTLAEAVLFHDHSDLSDHEAISVDFLSREYLFGWDEILP